MWVDTSKAQELIGGFENLQFAVDNYLVDYMRDAAGRYIFWDKQLKRAKKKINRGVARLEKTIDAVQL